MFNLSSFPFWQQWWVILLHDDACRLDFLLLQGKAALKNRSAVVSSISLPHIVNEVTKVISSSYARLGGDEPAIHYAINHASKGQPDVSIHGCLLSTDYRGFRIEVGGSQTYDGELKKILDRTASSLKTYQAKN